MVEYRHNHLATMTRYSIANRVIPSIWNLSKWRGVIRYSRPQHETDTCKFGGGLPVNHCTRAKRATCWKDSYFYEKSCGARKATDKLKKRWCISATSPVPNLTPSPMDRGDHVSHNWGKPSIALVAQYESADHSWVLVWTAGVNWTDDI